MLNFMRFQSLSIRARLLWLTLGLVVPLVLVGFVNLWGFWRASRTQLNDSLEWQAELAAHAFEQRIGAHRQTLETVALLANRDESQLALNEYLSAIVKTRPQWLDVQIIGTGGEVLISQSNKRLVLPPVSAREFEREAGRETDLSISIEQTTDEKILLLLLALPTADGNFVVARIDGAIVSEVFENIKLPEENIIAVFDHKNRMIYRSRVSPEQLSLDVSETALYTALSEKREGTIEVESPYDKIERVYGLARVESANLLVTVGIPSARLYEPARRQFLRQMFFSGLIAVLAVIAAYVIALSIVKPMRVLTAAARRFGAGDLKTRTDIAGGGSIRELAVTFNQMAEEIAGREEKLKELDRLKSDFVSSVSHELRTPLTTIKTLTRVLQRDRVSPPERDEFLEIIAAECDRQIDFVQNLLDLSRIESGAFKISPAETDVSEVLLECVEAHGQTALARRISLRLELPPAADLPFAFIDAGALRRIVSNLIENAVKYTPEGGAVRVAAFREDAAAARVGIRITDTGCGIAPEDLPYIFEKFYRGRPAQAESWAENDGNGGGKPPGGGAGNETIGTGLGLYLAKNLAEQINAEIYAESPANGQKRGSSFTVMLPADVSHE